MSTLAELVKSRRESGEGIFDSLGKSLRDKIKEKFDPRQFLNQSGLLVALFPQLKKFEAKKELGKIVPDNLSSSTPLTGAVLEKISKDTSITAKNSLVLPSIHRDFNVIRQNIGKLVKLEGGTPRLKADTWFKKSKIRETQYETKFDEKTKIIEKIAAKPVKKPSILKQILTLGGVGLGLSLFSGAASATTGEEGRADPGTEKEAMDFFMSKGWSKEQSAGIVGNLIAESSLKTNILGDGGRAYGIAQWHSDRQQLFSRVYGKDIRQSTFKEQLSFVDWELKNTERSAGNTLMRSTDAGQAAAIVDQYYERSRGLHRQRRINTANRLVGNSVSNVATQTTPVTQPTQISEAPKTEVPVTNNQSKGSTIKLVVPTVANKTFGEQLNQTSAEVSRTTELMKPRDKDVIVNNKTVISGIQTQESSGVNPGDEVASQFAFNRLF